MATVWQRPQETLTICFPSKDWTNVGTNLSVVSPCPSLPEKFLIIFLAGNFLMIVGGKLWKIDK